MAFTPLTTVLKGEGLIPEAMLVVSDGHQGQAGLGAQAGSRARGHESACFAEGQLPALTTPESLLISVNICVSTLPIGSILSLLDASIAAELSIHTLTKSKTTPPSSSPEWLPEAGPWTEQPALPHPPRLSAG